MLSNFDRSITSLILFSLLQNFIVLIYGDHIRTVELDTERDLYSSWKIEGDTDQIYYARSGSQLNKFHGFHHNNSKNFQLLEHAIGIWIIFPFEFENDTSITDISQENNVHVQGIFSFSSFAQLMSGVSVTYCMNKGSKIVIRTSSIQQDKLPVYTISPSETLSIYEWIEMTIPFPADSSRFFVEAHVLNPNEFILIDKIIGIYSQTVTSPRPTHEPRTLKTTTNTPKNSATSHHFIQSYVIFAFLTFLILV